MCDRATTRWAMIAMRRAGGLEAAFFCHCLNLLSPNPEPI
jgi:hypothetical protein